jgi:hypothetical protein
MEPEPCARTAFTLAPLHRRRDARRITAVALHQRAGRVYLGLDNGALEEHRLAPLAPSPGPHAGAPHGAAHGGAHGGAHAGPAPLCLRLQAEKHLFKGSGVAGLAVAFAAARVAALSEDGQVLLCTLESFHLAPVPGARAATAVAADGSGRFPAQLAVAAKVARGRSRVGIYDVVPGSATTSGHGAIPRAHVSGRGGAGRGLRGRRAQAARGGVGAAGWDSVRASRSAHRRQHPPPPSPPPAGHARGADRAADGVGGVLHHRRRPGRLRRAAPAAARRAAAGRAAAAPRVVGHRAGRPPERVPHGGVGLPGAARRARVGRGHAAACWRRRRRGARATRAAGTAARARGGGAVHRGGLRRRRPRV